MPVRLFIRQAVADFDEWRRGYDAGADLRARHNVRADGVHRGVDDPNDVTVFHDFDTPEDARRFADAPELRDATGVKPRPIVWLTGMA